MDSNYLDELKQLKEQKDADLEKLQEEASMNIPDLEETNIPLDLEEDPIPSEETIKFEPVSQTSEEKGPAPAGGRRARQPSEDELAAKKKKKRTRNIVLISLSSFVALLAILLVVFFAVKNANKSEYTYEYWGMGLDIENGVAEYDFFGNITTLTRFDIIGQPEYVAEFEDGKCVKETKYDAEGKVIHYYTHEYENGERILSSYFEGGELVYSERYTRKSSFALEAERTYYKEEGRTETATLTLKDGKLVTREVFKNNLLAQRTTHDGTMITVKELFDANGALETKTTYEYNREKKQLLTETEYDANNAVLTRKVNTYDEKNGLLKDTSCFDGNGDLLYNDAYTYNHSNNPIRQVHYIINPTTKQKEIEYSIINEFDKSNRVIKTTRQLPNGEIESSFGYVYDDNGYISRKNSYRKETIEWYVNYTRTASGTVTQEERYNSNNILLEKILYNDKGLITEQTTYNEAGVTLQQIKNQYDAKQKKNRQTITTYAEDGSVLKTVDEQLDAKGLVTIRITEEPAAGLFEHVLFAYNDKGVAERLTFFAKNGQILKSTAVDEKSRVVNESVYENGIEKEYNEYVYNDKDQVAVKKCTDRRTGAFRSIAYTYNETGLLIESAESDEKNIILNKKKYDELGRVSEEAILDTAAGEVKETNKYEYDEQNRVIACDKFDKDNEFVSKTLYYYRDDGSHYFVVYDENNNIIEDSRNPDVGPSTDVTDSDNTTDTSSDEITDDTDVTDTESENSGSTSSTDENSDDPSDGGSTSDEVSDESDESDISDNEENDVSNQE